jgi:copper transport protein
MDRRRALRIAAHAAFWWLVMVGAATGLIWTAGPASAHATVVSSTPTDGAHLDSSPAVLSFDLNEAVSLVQGSAQLIDVGGTRYPFAAQRLEAGRQRIVLELGRSLRDGAYLATARVVSADTHVVSLSIRFTVGAATDHGQWADAGTGQSVVEGYVLYAVKAGVYAGLALSAGLYLACRWVWSDAIGTRRFVAIYRLGTGLLVLGLLGRVAVLAADQAGGLVNASPSTVVAIVETPFGAALVAAAALGVITVVRPPGRGRTARGLGVLHAAAAVTAVTLGGHGAATEWWPLPFVATFVHLYAVAVWLGGVVAIVGVLRAVPRLRRWHRVALGHIALALSAGIVLALLQVRPVGALVSTSYGWALVIKVALVSAAITAGYLTYRTHRSHASRTIEPDSEQRRGRAVIVEAGLALLVITTTAVLSSLIPAKDSYTTNVATRLNFGGADDLHIDIDTVRRGPQVVKIVYPDQSPGVEVGIELSSAQANVARLPVEVSRSDASDGDTVWTSDHLIVPSPGRWKVTVRFDDGQGPKLASFYYQVL